MKDTRHFRKAHIVFSLAEFFPRKGEKTTFLNIPKSYYVPYKIDVGYNRIVVTPQILHYIKEAGINIFKVKQKVLTDKDIAKIPLLFYYIELSLLNQITIYRSFNEDDPFVVERMYKERKWFLSLLEQILLKLDVYNPHPYFLNTKTLEIISAIN